MYVNVALISRLGPIFGSALFQLPSQKLFIGPCYAFYAAELLVLSVHALQSRVFRDETGVSASFASMQNVDTSTSPEMTYQSLKDSSDTDVTS
jgi:hypothetical protein